MGRFLSILLLASAIPALADDDDWRRRRDDRNSGYGYGRNDGYYGRDDGYYGRDGAYGRDRGGYGNNRGGYGNRGVLASVQQNLRRAASESRGLSSREHDRYNNAFRHLSEFESRYAQGKWDNGKLDKAIEDVNNVVRHNPMSSRSRQMLSNDLANLRQFRANRGGNNTYGYGNGNSRLPNPW